MTSASPEFRVEQALTSTEPAPALFQLAAELRDAGMPQSDLQSLFESFATRQRTDTEESCYDALVDALDFIVGWCTPSRAFYLPAAV